MRLTCSHLYSYENKFNHICENALNNHKKTSSYNFSWDSSFILIRIISKRFGIILTIFLFSLSQDFWDEKKGAKTTATFDVNLSKMNQQIFKLDKTVEKGRKVVYKKENEWYIEWRRVTRNDKECYNER